MRILTWNINGIGTLSKYHPWNTLKTTEAILDELSADIICFQGEPEVLASCDRVAPRTSKPLPWSLIDYGSSLLSGAEMKTSRAKLDALIAVPGKYHGFFSFPAAKGGYSGVAVYTKSTSVVPLRAEEGLSGCLQPKPLLSTEERVSANQPAIENVDLMADDDGGLPNSLGEFDKEGRALVLDFGLFVLINLYCVADSGDTRYHYKMNYYYLLQERVRMLVEEGREVIVLGDLNSCPSPIDHCEGMLPKHKDSFFDYPHRAWLRDWIAPNGLFLDTTRARWPNREGMYTCWNTKISARDGNYGTRIDLILITPGLRRWVKDADIQPLVKGSDHCPVFLDLHDTIVDDEGRELKLSDAMQSPSATSVDPREPPRICAKNWDEYSAKQTLLSTFFTPRTASASTSSESQINPMLTTPPMPTELQISSGPSLPQTPVESGPAAEEAEASVTQSLQKRKRPIDDCGQVKKAKVDKPKNGQSKLSSFFQKPKPAQAKGRESPIEVYEDEKSVEDAQLDRDIEMAIMLSQTEPSTSPSTSKAPRVGNKEAWSSLLAPLQVPNCTVHGEPSKLYTVNKPGPSKGKTFFLCSRPVGPGYDMGKSKRPRDEVDPAYRCDFFKWSSDVRRQSTQRGAAPQ